MADRRKALGPLVVSKTNPRYFSVGSDATRKPST